MRQQRLRRIVRYGLLVVPGCALLQSSVSCGDVLRQTLLSAGTEFLSTAADDLISAALGNLLGQTDTTSTTGP
ncbi:MAG: hypothetical protein HRF43_18030 [Phycisphaerae bacterium]